MATSREVFAPPTPFLKPTFRDVRSSFKEVRTVSHDSKALKGDNPIHKPAEDLLSRDGFAQQFVQQLLQLDAREGFVVGVAGPWGYGKTSFLNLLQHHLEVQDHTVLHFNPWMFT
ncbi:MAG: hypothetical protein KDC10_15850, partial [Calditrichaeota bacterium]|nr:hypothetical protein [Calditrichota bacterium]